ncbi:MAG: Rid family detoxifying hydrolase [Proteobacteria bacterium]|nr:Rid family detoxifying hydrolase [Pseudomonadota bacterium]
MSNAITLYESFPDAPKAVGPYSPAVRAGGMAFLSGQVGLNPQTMQLVGAGIEEQTEQVLRNLLAVLSGMGLAFKDVVKTTIFLTDLSHFQTVNKIYGERLEGHKPARSTFQVSALPLGAIVEIEMTALDRAA